MIHSVPWTIQPDLGAEPLPSLRVFLRLPGGSFKGYRFLIDSGADVSMAPREVCEVIGVVWEDGLPIQLQGISSKAECAVEARIHWVEVGLDIVGARLELPICFAEGNSLFLIGRHTFFDAFQIKFDQLNLMTHLESNDSWHLI